MKFEMKPPVPGEAGRADINSVTFSCAANASIVVESEEAAALEALGWRRVGAGLNSLVAMGSASNDQTPLAKLIRAYNRSSNGNNPIDQPDTTEVTVTMGTVSGAYPAGSSYFFAAGSALVAEALSHFAFCGGYPYAVNANQMVLAAANTFNDASGNLNQYVAGSVGLPLRLNQWNSALECHTDTIEMEVAFLGKATDNIVQVLVNDRYVSKAGYLLPSAGACFMKIVAPSEKFRKMRIEWPNDVAVYWVKTKNTYDTVVKPPSETSVKALILSTSYGESYTADPVGAPYKEAGANLWQIWGKKCGISNVIQGALGATGILADNGGTRAKLRDQIPVLLEMHHKRAGNDPIDVVVIDHGYNDRTFNPGDISAELLECLNLLRSELPNVPIEVFGSQTGRDNNNSATINTENAIKAAVTQFADRLCVFSPVSTDARPWITGTGFAVRANKETTIDIATSTFTSTLHQYRNGSIIRLATTGALPTGASVATDYYVVNQTANTWQISSTLGGAPIALSGTQSGTHTSTQQQTTTGVGNADLDVSEDRVHPTKRGHRTMGGRASVAQGSILIALNNGRL